MNQIYHEIKIKIIVQLLYHNFIQEVQIKKKNTLLQLETILSHAGSKYISSNFLYDFLPPAMLCVQTIHNNVGVKQIEHTE